MNTFFIALGKILSENAIFIVSFTLLIFLIGCVDYFQMDTEVSYDKNCNPPSTLSETSCDKLMSTNDLLKGISIFIMIVSVIIALLFITNVVINTLGLKSPTKTTVKKKKKKISI